MNTIDVRVGNPLRHGSLSLFPLLVESAAPIDYSCLDAAVRQGDLAVLPGWTVASGFRLQNQGNARLLLLSSQSLPGTGQACVLNTSILVPAGATIEIPSRLFSAEPSRQDDLPAKQLGDYQRQFAYVAGAAGLAVAAGRDFVTVDLFDRATTCQAVWKRCLGEAAVIAGAFPSAAGWARNLAVQQLLISLSRAAWHEVERLGDGSLHHAELLGGSASSLSWQGHLIHAKWRRTSVALPAMA